MITLEEKIDSLADRFKLEFKNNDIFFYDKLTKKEFTTKMGKFVYENLYSDFPELSPEEILTKFKKDFLETIFMIA